MTESALVHNFLRLLAVMSLLFVSACSSTTIIETASIAEPNMVSAMEPSSASSINEGSDEGSNEPGDDTNTVDVITNNSATEVVDEASVPTPAPTSVQAPSTPAPVASELAMRIDALPIGDEAGPVFPQTLHLGVSFEDPWEELAVESGTKDPVPMGPVTAPGSDLNEWCLTGVGEGKPAPGYFARTEWGHLDEAGNYLIIWMWTSTYIQAAEAENDRERRLARNEHCTDILLTKEYGGNGIPDRKTIASFHDTPAGLSTRFVDDQKSADGYLLLSIDAGNSITHIRISGIPDDQLEDMLPLMDEAATKVVDVLEIVSAPR